MNIYKKILFYYYGWIRSRRARGHEKIHTSSGYAAGRLGLQKAKTQIL